MGFWINCGAEFLHFDDQLMSISRSIHEWLKDDAWGENGDYCAWAKVGDGQDCRNDLQGEQMNIESGGVPPHHGSKCNK